MRYPIQIRFWYLAAALILAGCGTHWTAPFGPYRTKVPLDQIIENPMFVPIADSELVWNQIVDEVDDYFRIQREQRPHEAGGILMEGKIETFPMIGSTLLEPWRRDSTPGYEKLHATLQSIRRQATVRVIPRQGGFLVDINVLKELEDVSQPERSTVGRTAARYDQSLVRNDPDEKKRPPGGSITLGWITLGRDVGLEQQMLTEIRGRLTNIGPPKHGKKP